MLFLCDRGAIRERTRLLIWVLRVRVPSITRAEVAERHMRQAQTLRLVWVRIPSSVLKRCGCTLTACGWLAFTLLFLWGVGREAECSGLLNRRTATFHRFETCTPRHAVIAQLAEQLIRNQQVVGSIPTGGSTTGIADPWLS